MHGSEGGWADSNCKAIEILCLLLTYGSVFRVSQASCTIKNRQFSAAGLVLVALQQGHQGHLAPHNTTAFQQVD